ncbi:MAG: DUF4276 family protein [Armatimonadota bacterium]
MASVTIYVEGGGGERRGLQQLRLAFREFFSEFAGSMPKVVACGGRGAAYEDFMMAVRQSPSSAILLLVDAERPVSGDSSTQHLADPPDRWDLRGIPDDRVHLMVQTIEAWMVADPDALSAYFGNGFNENALPGRRNPEEIPKDDLKRALEQAGRDTKKKGYHEINDGTEILKRLDPATVRDKCVWCRRLFALLAHVTGIVPADLQ